MTLDMPTLFNTFKTSKATGEGLGSDPQQAIIWNDVGTGIVPIGGLIAWLKTFVNGTPAQELIPNYVECNGQVLADGASPLDGMTIPDLNGSSGTERFLRGSTSSGTTGGSETHNHAVILNKDWLGSGDNLCGMSITGSTSTLPSYYEVVWVMRIY